MSNALLARAPKHVTPLVAVTEKTYPAWVKEQPSPARAWLEAQGFKGKPGSFCVLPDAQGGIARVIAGLSEPPSLWDLGDFSLRLPEGAYGLEAASVPLPYQEWLALGCA